MIEHTILRKRITSKQTHVVRIQTGWNAKGEENPKIIRLCVVPFLDAPLFHNSSTVHLRKPVYGLTTMTVNHKDIIEMAQ